MNCYKKAEPNTKLFACEFVPKFEIKISHPDVGFWRIKASIGSVNHSNYSITILNFKPSKLGSRSIHYISVWHDVPVDE